MFLKGSAFPQWNERCGSFDANGFVEQPRVISPIARYFCDFSSSLFEQIREPFTITHIR